MSSDTTIQPSSLHYSQMPKIVESRWTDVGLIVGLVACLAIGILATLGVFSFIGTTNATYLSYGMYGGAILFLTAEMIKIALSCRAAPSYLGSTQQNLDSTKTTPLFDDEIESQKEKNPPPFSEEDLTFFISWVMEKKEASGGCICSLNNLNYRAIYSISDDDYPDSINIMADKGTFAVSLHINEERKVTSILSGVLSEGDLQKDNKIPVHLYPLILAFCLESVRETSSYKIYNEDWLPLGITIGRQGLKTFPEYHLNAFCDALFEYKLNSNTTCFEIRVNFLTHTMKPLITVDGGGPSRDYLCDMFLGLTRHSSLCFETIRSSRLLLPIMRESVNHLTDEECNLTDEECKLYQNIGSVLMFCCLSDPEPSSRSTYIIGSHFDDSLFSVISCLTDLEIDTPFEKLSSESLLKMCGAMQNVYHDDYTRNLLGPLFLNGGNHLSEKELCKAGKTLKKLDLLSEDLDNQLGENPETNKKIFKANFKIIEDTLLNVALNVAKPYLPPIHAIAQGMKRFLCGGGDVEDSTLWNKILYKQDAKLISLKIQGDIDRKRIAKSIVFNEYKLTPEEKKEIKKKVKWLKEWILEEAKDNEIIQFIRFLTGAFGLPEGNQIKVKSQVKAQSEDYSPIPEAHSCTYEMALSPQPVGNAKLNDRTKDAFINVIKTQVLKAADIYTDA